MRDAALRVIGEALYGRDTSYDIPDMAQEAARIIREWKAFTEPVRRNQELFERARESQAGAQADLAGFAAGKNQR